MLLYCTAPYSTMACRGKLRLRTMRGTRRVAPLLAYRPLRLALQCRQRSVMRYTACNAGRPSLAQICTCNTVHQSTALRYVSYVSLNFSVANTAAVVGAEADLAQQGAGMENCLPGTPNYSIAQHTIDVNSAIRCTAYFCRLALFRSSYMVGPS